MSCTRGSVQNDIFRPSWIPTKASSGEMRCLKVKQWCDESWFAIYWLRYFYCWIGQMNWLMILTIAYFLYACFILISHLHNKYSFKAADLFGEDFKMSKFVKNLTIVLAAMSIPELALGGLLNYNTTILPTFVYGISGIFGCIFYAILFCFGILIKSSLQLDANLAIYVVASFVVAYGAFLIVSFAEFPYIALAIIFTVVYAAYMYLVYLQVGKTTDGEVAQVEGGGQGNTEPLIEEKEGESGGGGGNGGQQNADFKDLNEFLGNIKQIVKEEWERKNTLSKILFIPLVPFVIIFWLTIPTPDPKKFKRISWLIYPILSSIVVMLAFTGRLSGKVTFGDDTRVLTIFIVLPIALLFGIIMYFISKDGKPVPVVHSTFSLLLIFSWVLYLVKMIVDVAGWNSFNNYYYTSQFFGSIYIGIGLMLRHMRSVKEAVKGGSGAELGMLLVQYGFFSSIFSMVVFWFVGYFRWLNETGDRKSPRFKVFGDIFDTRGEFFLFVIFFAVLYRAGDLLTMKWRTNFNFEERHKHFGWHILAFYLILMVILDNLEFSK